VCTAPEPEAIAVEMPIRQAGVDADAVCHTRAGEAADVRSAKATHMDAAEAPTHMDAAEAATHMTAAETAPVSPAATAAAGQRVTCQSAGERSSGRQNDHHSP